MQVESAENRAAMPTQIISPFFQFLFPPCAGATFGFVCGTREVCNGRNIENFPASQTNQNPGSADGLRTDKAGASTSSRMEAAAPQVA